MEVRRSALVEFSADRMFDIIERAEHYPEFLPWCAGATILERTDSLVTAEITVDYHGVRFTFITRNPKRRPDWLAVRLERGPFRRFEGEWHLTPLTPDACKIAFTLQYEMGGGLGRVAASVFDHVANTFVDAFIARALATLPPQGDHT
ncbi:MAG: type II toxin-antitoxin system RatA family toxin [Burkholderiales bacterium]